LWRDHKSLAQADGAHLTEIFARPAGLTVEQAKEAKKGAEYASNEYEKYKVAYKQAKKDLEATLARHEKERKDLAEEREVIKEIMRYLGVLHDVKATEKSIAAGGKDSTIDPETGVSEVKAVSTAKLEVLVPSAPLSAPLPGGHVGRGVERAVRS
jgi:hypothetical protein